MLFPTELSLRTTKDGIRLFSKPIDELDRLQTSVGKWRALTADKADELLRQYKDASTLRIRTTLKLSHATNAGLNLFGQSLLDYDMNYNRINGVFYSPEDMTRWKSRPILSWIKLLLKFILMMGLILIRWSVGRT